MNKVINRENTKNFLKLGSIILGFLIIFGYALFESYDFLQGPNISLIEPQNGSAVSTSSISVKGKASRIKDLFINNKPVLIDREGNFNETILLAPGYNISLLSALDRFKRTIEYKLELVYLK